MLGLECKIECENYMFCLKLVRVPGGIPHSKFCVILSLAFFLPSARKTMIAGGF